MPEVKYMSIGSDTSVGILSNGSSDSVSASLEKFLNPSMSFPIVQRIISEETAEAANAAGQLGGRVRELRRYTIPGTDVSHAVVIVDKLSPTPPQYPRRWARMLKKPL